MLNKLLGGTVASRSDHYFIYVRDKNGVRITGHTICVMVRDGKIFHGTSLCSKKDNFNYETGRELALKKALESYRRYEERNS